MVFNEISHIAKKVVNRQYDHFGIALAEGFPDIACCRFKVRAILVRNLLIVLIDTQFHRAARCALC
jgi:hypothetical protein